MAEDVDSWEELIKDVSCRSIGCNPISDHFLDYVLEFVCCFKLMILVKSFYHIIQLNLNAFSPKKTPDGLGDRSNVPNSTTKKTDLSYSSALNKNLPAAPKILARNAVTNSNPAKNIQITFEDNGTRTQFIPQQQQNAKVKILQRPREQNRNDNGTSTIKNG